MKDTTLFGGMPAQEYSGPDGSAAKNKIDEVRAYLNTKEALNATVAYAANAPLAFDFDSFSHSADFVKIVTGSTDLLQGEKYAGKGYVPVG
jgi:hypothetical protein